MSHLRTFVLAALAAWFGYVVGYRKREHDEHQERFRTFYDRWPRDEGRGSGMWRDERLR